MKWAQNKAFEVMSKVGKTNKLILGKICFEVLGPRLAQNKFFELFKNSMHGIPLIFCMKLKIDLNDFFGKNIVLGLLDKKWSKMVFLNSCIEFFWFFT